MANNGLPGHVAGTSALPPKADVVGGIRVERRIEINQVNALGRDAVAENLEIVAVVERLHPASPVTSSQVGIIAKRSPRSIGDTETVAAVELARQTRMERGE